MKKILLVFSVIIVLVFSLSLNSCKKNDPTSIPVIKTLSITNIEATTASTGGEITYDGGEIVTVRGICWSTSENPSTSDSKVIDNSGSEPFNLIITGLSSSSLYHVRAFATNSNGTAYGEDISFKTIARTPLINTTSVFLITSVSASSGGSILSDGGATIIEKGVCWSTNVNPTITDSKTTDGNGTDSFTSSFNGLTSNTLYHIRAYATNSSGTAYGQDLSFTTSYFDSTPIVDNDNMLLGNPSTASPVLINANNYLMVKPQYVLSYNNSKQTTNWTSWHLYSGDIGSTPRQDDFRSDATLPASWYHVTDFDFQFSTYGFDRGHMCPSADRTSSVANNSATFLMTNMIPQSQKNNQITWANLENYCRTLIDGGNELYIICGPYGAGGTSAKGTFSVLASGVTVPSKTWKIIVVLPNGNNDLSRISSSTRVIAVVMPNDEIINSDWRTYRVKVNDIETLTGYDFLSNVSTTVQNVIEEAVDTGK